MEQRFTILVNSTDSYADCWAPFFTLLKKYWPGCDLPIVLNTEHLRYEHEGLDIRSSMVADPKDSKRLSWSECLMRCLDQIDDDLILYTHDDFFPDGPVRADVLDQLAAVARRTKCASLRVMEVPQAGPWRPHADDLVWEVPSDSPHRVSLQAGFWDPKVMRRWLRSHENAWDFEVLGSRRLRRATEPVLCVNRDRFGHRDDQVIPYFPTGIEKGRWNREMVDIFAKNDIEVDFSARGFWDQEAGHAEAYGLARRLRRAPKRVIPRLRSFAGRFGAASR